MTHEEFLRKKSAMTDTELIEKAELALSELCRTGCKSFRMTVPPRVDDTDVLIAELIRRYKSRTKADQVVPKGVGVRATDDVVASNK